jgi:hypothetical protein
VSGRDHAVKAGGHRHIGHLLARALKPLRINVNATYDQYRNYDRPSNFAHIVCSKPTIELLRVGIRNPQSVLPKPA